MTSNRRDKPSAQELAGLSKLRTLWKLKELIFGKSRLILIFFIINDNKEDDAHKPEHNGQSQQIAKYFPHKVFGTHSSLDTPLI